MAAGESNTDCIALINSIRPESRGSAGPATGQGLDLITGYEINNLNSKKEMPDYSRHLPLSDQ